MRGEEITRRVVKSEVKEKVSKITEENLESEEEENIVAES